MPFPARILAALATTVAFAAFLVGCGGDDKNNDSFNSSQASTPASGAVGNTSPPVTPVPGATAVVQPSPVTSPVPPATAPAAPPASSTGASCNGSLASIQRSNRKSWPSAPERIIDPNKTYVALIKTNKGDITATLAAKDAPLTVNSFVFLACNGFFDGLTWHRVVKTPQPFVIQGGDPAGNGSGGPGYRFNNETSPNLKHDSAGVLSMANAGPNTNGSQFFITLAATPSLDGGYNVFGKVTDGMNAVNAIAVGDKIESVSIRES